MVLRKMLIQDVGWDEPVDFDIDKRWELWMQFLTRIEGVPRCYAKSSADPGVVEMHTFVDASYMAYSVVVYFIFVFNDRFDLC